MPTSDSAMDIIRKVKPPVLRDGKKFPKEFHYDKRHYFLIEDFPIEMKHEDKSGKLDIELTRVQGVTFNAVREIVECVDDLKKTIDDLKNRLKILENKTI